MDFKPNEGRIDRVFRIIIGTALLVGGFFFLSSPLMYVVMLIGLVFVITGVSGFCGLYTLLGMNTCGCESCCPSSEGKEEPAKGPAPGKIKKKDRRMKS